MKLHQKPAVTEFFENPLPGLELAFEDHTFSRQIMRNHKTGETKQVQHFEHA